MTAHTFQPGDRVRVRAGIFASPTVEIIATITQVQEKTWIAFVGSPNFKVSPDLLELVQRPTRPVADPLVVERLALLLVRHAAHWRDGLLLSDAPPIDDEEE